MKLKNFQHLEDYCFILTFTNGDIKQVDLKNLISQHVSPDLINTAQINTDWGCLEFMGGMVDIEPKTLYSYACADESQQAA